MNVKDILNEEKFVFEKKYGQNFILDKNLLDAIVEDCCLSYNTNVLEIGPGSGTLTMRIAQSASKVLCYEIDKKLQPILEKTVGNLENVEVVYKDVMLVTENEIKQKLGDDFTIVANLPYYITTPIIFKFLDFSSVQALNIMVQKEVAERIIATKGKDYGVLSIMIGAVADVKIMRIVKASMFTPAPNVDSAIVQIKMNRNKFKINNFAIFKKLVHGSFSMRRKTLMNNIMKTFSFSREQTAALLASFKEGVRAEQLGIEEFVLLANKIEQIL